MRKRKGKGGSEKNDDFLQSSAGNKGDLSSAAGMFFGVARFLRRHVKISEFSANTELMTPDFVGIRDNDFSRVVVIASLTTASSCCVTMRAVRNISSIVSFGE